MPPPSLSIFDAPTREACVVRRQMSSTPLQALALLNDEMYIETSRKLAELMFREGGASPAARLAWALRCGDVAAGHGGRGSDPRNRTEPAFGPIPRMIRQPPKNFWPAGESPRDKTIDSAELAAYTTAASVILNLDEVITRQ